MLIQDIDRVDGIKLEDRAWINRHIKDIEIYLSSSVGAILSGEDEVDAPNRARADEMTLQNTVDELLKYTSQEIMLKLLGGGGGAIHGSRSGK